MDIGGSNASLGIAVSGLFSVPQLINGFAADDMWEFDEMENVEVLMGVDGRLSGGWVWKPQPQRITLQPDSDSAPVFDTWNGSMQATEQIYLGQGILRIPSIGIKLVMSNGFLTRYKLPAGKKLIQPRTFQITWNTCIPQPA